MNTTDIRTEAGSRQRGNRAVADWVLAGLAILLTLLLFHFLGQRPAKAVDGQSALGWIFFQWFSGDGDFSHGWLMPVFALYVVWTQRKALYAAPQRPHPAGAVIAIGALLLHVAAYRVQQPRISLIAMVLFMWGGTLFACGWATARLLLFPLGYMVLAFGSFWLITITFKLRIFACAVAELTLNGIGIDTVRQGTILHSRAGGGFTFNVADPCSGLRSLVVMTALAAPLAYLAPLSLARKWVLFASSLPLAVVANVLRIIAIALIAEVAGQEFAIKVFHDFSGYVVFFIAIVLLMATGEALKASGAKQRKEKEPCDSDALTTS